MMAIQQRPIRSGLQALGLPRSEGQLDVVGREPFQLRQFDLAQRLSRMQEL